MNAFGADLEFDHEENRSGNQYRVDPAPDTRDDELKKDRSFQIREGCLENGDLLSPRIPLRHLDIKIRIRRKIAEN